VVDVVAHDERRVEHEAIASARAEEDHRPEREVAKLRRPPAPADHAVLLAAGVVELLAEDERIGVLDPARRVDGLPEGILEPARMLRQRVAVGLDHARLRLPLAPEDELAVHGVSEVRRRPTGVHELPLVVAHVPGHHAPWRRSVLAARVEELDKAQSVVHLGKPRRRA
jgi:hypothetical protein